MRFTPDRFACQEKPREKIVTNFENMQTATLLRKTAPLSSEDKVAIAAVLTWDLCKKVTPEEVEAIQVNGEWVAVRLSFQRAVPIHRDVFRSIRQQQQVDVN